MFGLGVQRLDVAIQWIACAGERRTLPLVLATPGHPGVHRRVPTERITAENSHVRLSAGKSGSALSNAKPYSRPHIHAKAPRQLSQGIAGV